jgi:cytochrome c-type biogenesis protein CcmF
MFLLVNNLLLLAAMLSVLFGTLFPLMMDGLGLGKYSVGAPWFNAVFVPLMALLIIFMGIGPSTRWKDTKASQLRAQLFMALFTSIVVGLLFPLFYSDEYNIAAALAVSFAGWLVFSSIANMKDKIRNAPNLWQGLRRLGVAYYGMVLAHIGFAFTVLGVCLTSQYSLEQDLRMAPGDSLSLSGYEFSFQGTGKITGPNYIGDEGVINVSRQGEFITTLNPQKRSYNAQSGSMMTEAAIDGRLMRDLYVALGEPLANGAWAVRVHYKPFVRWMWLGSLMMGFGGLLAVADKRYRLALPAVGKNSNVVIDKTNTSAVSGEVL